MMMQDALPGIKRFFKPLGQNAYVQGFWIRLVTAFVMHVGRMSATQAAGAIRTEARHRAAVIRFLAKLQWSNNWSLLVQLADCVLQAEQRRGGIWVFIVDQTYCGQQGQKTENTFSRANYRPRSHKSKRRQKKHAKRSCHGFVMGLLITPSGLRLPSCRCYYADGYCKQKNKSYRTQTEWAAELIRAVVVPAAAEVFVLGDTAFDADSIRAACTERKFRWIVPLNPERVLAGQKGQRPKVRSLAENLTANQFAPVRLKPSQGPYAAMRRVARCRLGPKMKARTFYVHRERRAVHHVGDVQLVFSTKVKPEAGKPVTVQKILMTNDRQRSAAAIVELYSLRWQIELFFKELKSTLGLHQYRFRQFAKVEGWVAACLLTFLYLEWYRIRQLRRRDLTAKDKAWWRAQRTYGLCQAVRQDAEEIELVCLAEWTRTPGGLKRLKKQLRAAVPAEYRKAG
jgi:Transposase DDE domain